MEDGLVDKSDSELLEIIKNKSDSKYPKDFIESVKREIENRSLDLSKMNDKSVMQMTSYQKKFKKWDGELSATIPRKVRLKLSLLFLIPTLLIFIGLILYGTSYFILTVLLNKNADYALVVGLVPFFILVILFYYVGVADMKSVRVWKKVVGRIKSIKKEMRGRNVVRVYDVSYEFEGKFFSKEFIRSAPEFGGLSDCEMNDPVILLVNPENLNSCILYCYSSWRAIKEDQT